MVVFLDPVSPLQAFGYSIALGGLVYYKLGGEKLKGYIAEGQRSWQEYGTRQPIMRKVIIFGLVCLALLIVLGGVASHVNPEYDVLKWKGILGEKGT
jgi:MFS superfamily sulfate permease-like transporter